MSLMVDLKRMTVETHDCVTSVPHNVQELHFDWGLTIKTGISVRVESVWSL